MAERQDDEREFWLERRKALLIEVRAIEKRFPTSTVTVRVRKDDAEKLGLLESLQKH